MIKANMDVREYLTDHGLTQGMLAKRMGVSDFKISRMLKNELSQKEKEALLNIIDAIASDSLEEYSKEDSLDEAATDEGNKAEAEEVEESEEIEDIDEIEESEENETDEEDEDEESSGTKFQIGDRVKIPAKQLTIGVVSDIWMSLAQKSVMYAVKTEDGRSCLYAEDQLEPEPIPITYTFESVIDGNVAVTIMYATQGEKTWVFARGHAHIIHDGAVGLAQAVSYSARRMFESLDTKQNDRIYFKNKGGDSK